MIQLFLIILILLCLVILLLKKEPFSNDECNAYDNFNHFTINSCSDFKDNDLNLSIIYKMPQSKYFKITEKMNHYVIINDVDSKMINKVIKINSDDPNFKKDTIGDDIQYTFTLNKSNYQFIYGNRYNITINLLNSDEPPKIISSNTIIVKAETPTIKNTNLDANKNTMSISQDIIDTLKNKTFDIYI